jgi:uncharacterized SAM-binding protein YcdF (DUF218 family)
MLLRSYLVDPILISVLLGLLGLLLSLRWRLAGMAVVLLGLGWLYALSTAFVAERLSALVEPPPAAVPALGGLQPQAIVVLSAGLHRATPELGGDTATNETLERVRYAARLHRQTGLPLLVTGGAVGGAEKTLARTMADALVQDFAVPVRWEEHRARTTYENAVFSAELLRRDGITTVYLVSHARHIPRAVAIFESVGLTVVPAPTYFTTPSPDPGLLDFLPSADKLRDSWLAIRELVGKVFYRFSYAPAGG